MAINEETLKQRHVIPYLMSLGFDTGELHFEESFTIRLGRQEHKAPSIRGRLDVLVRRSDKNLFVLEAKGEGEKITQDEIDQAISYARLVHPVAPFAVVMSGHDARIFETISKTEVTGTALCAAGEMRVELPAEEYQNALRYFVGYSRANLIAFCRKQVLDRTESIRSTPENPGRRYVREIYEQDSSVAEAYGQFLVGVKQAFVVVGPSGVGKSSWLLHTALDAVDKKQPALFYFAREVLDGVIDTVASDLHWNLAPTTDNVTAAKKTFEYLAKDQLLIFVDGIEQLSPDKARRVLTEFLRVIHGRNIRLICTCKHTAWPLLLNDDGVPTLIGDRTFGANDRPGFYLDGISDKQFYKIIGRYRSWFRFNGPLGRKFLEEARRNLFLLRTAFEVARRNGLSAIVHDSAEIVQAYLDAQLSRFDIKEHARLMLKKIGRLVFDGDSSTVELGACLEAQSFPYDPQIIDRLVDVGLLQSFVTESGQTISFSFDIIRDFVICRYTLALQKEAPSRVDEILLSRLTPLRQDLLNTWYMLAPVEHKRYLERGLRERAEDYARFYENVLNRHFPNIASSFFPNAPDGSGKVGFVGHIDLVGRRITWHGFRKISAEQERVVFFPHVADNELAFSSGVSVFHRISAAKGFENVNVASAVLTGEIVSGLRRIVKQGLLDESHSMVLLEEKILAMACAHLRQELKLKPGVSPGSCLPLDLAEVRKAVLRKRARKMAEHQLIESKRNRGEIQESWLGGVVSYSYSFTQDDMEIIEREADAAVEAGVLFSGRNDADNSAEVLVFSVVQRLESLGIKRISSTLVPEPNGRGSWVSDLWSGPVRRKFVLGLYEAFVNEYQALVDRCFPLLAQNMRLRTNLPARFFMDLEEKFGQNGAWIFGAKDPEITSNQVEMVGDQEFRYDHEEDIVFYEGREWKSFLAMNVSLDGLFSPMSVALPVWVERLHCLVRALVYKQIKEELPDALLVLASEYGVQLKSSDVGI